MPSRAAMLDSSIMGRSGSLRQSGSKSSSPEERVLQYLYDHPEGAGFDTLEKATGVSGRNISRILARLIDTGKARGDFPLFFAVNQARTS